MNPRLVFALLALVVGFNAIGCTQGRKTEEGALIGGGTGAGAGLIATAAGASPWWILGGAAIGAAGGALVGHSMDHADEENAYRSHSAQCRTPHYQCLNCSAIFCNSSVCPNCNSTRYRVYSNP